MDKSWYVKGVIFLSVLLVILLLIILIYYIIQKLKKAQQGHSEIIEEADDVGLSHEELLSSTVREKLLEEKTYHFETTKPYEAYEEDVIEKPSEEEQIILSTSIVLNLKYDESANYLHGSIKEITGLEIGDFSHIRYHLKIEGKKKLRFRSPLRSTEDLKVPVTFGLSPVLPRDLTHKVLRIRLYGLKKKLPTLLRTEHCLGEANVELARHEFTLREGDMVTTDHAILPITPQFPVSED